MTLSAPPTSRRKSHPQHSSPRQRQSIYSLISIIFLAVIWLEYSTPSVYIFGYLYTGAIVLTYRYLDRRRVLSVTLSAAALTLLNLFFPSVEIRNLPTLANRLIAVLALLLTGYLTERNRFYEIEIAQQQAKIQTQAQLAELKEDFVSTLTHDLKTPLLGAIETVKLFQTEQFGQVNTEQHKVLKVMERSHNETLQLVESMLDVYRNDAEGMALQLAPINLEQTLTDVIDLLSSLASSRRVQVCLTPNSKNLNNQTPNNHTHPIEGDEPKLRRVFENLIANAINHTAAGTQINITLQTIQSNTGKAQQIQIQDNGPGINAKELPHLFVRFYQGHSNRQSKGYGLGLYLCRQIIEAHGGKIWAESPEHKGAIFYCLLPVSTQL